MFDTPRCREWTPLATQQLRLRNLIQIVGYNIRPPERLPLIYIHRFCFYFTLHETSMAAPFYTSERIGSPHPKWRELHTDVTQRRASTNLLIRIWCHIEDDPDKNPEQNLDKHHQSDLIIQTWGVYFSGLRLIGANLTLDFTSDSFKNNTLVFQMHGGYFCSYESLNLEVIPAENLYEYSVSSGSSKDSTSKIPIEANYLQTHRIIKECRSVSPSKKIYKYDDISKSSSPTERTFRQNFAQLKPASRHNVNKKSDEASFSSLDHEVKVFTMTDTSCDISVNSSREELFNDIDVSETAESYNSRRDRIPKCRYLCLNFLKSEIRPSYNATKLQELHLLQYSIKKRKDTVNAVKEKIYRKSPIKKEISAGDDLMASRMRKTRNSLFDDDVDCDVIADSAGPAEEKSQVISQRLPLKLNDLLTFRTHPSPSQRLEHARMTKRLEVLRFRRRLLLDERDAKIAAIRRLKEKYAKIFEENQDIGSELMMGYHALSRRAERLKQSHQSTGALRELASRTQRALVKRRCELPCELAEVFRIECDGENKWWICGVHMPVFDDDTPKRLMRAPDAVAAGYAAHCTQVAAGLMAQPLRYRIRVKGSESTVYDDLTHELPDPSIPLYPRGGDTMLFRYGVFLLNKNVAQLLWGKGMPVCDIRPTLANLKRLLTSNKLSLTESSPVDTAGCLHSHSLRSLIASERGQTRQFNRFKDSFDGHSPISSCGLRRHWHSRSVGSYRDEREIRRAHLSSGSPMGSEPLLHEPNSSDELKSKRLYLKQHSSDSQISRFSTEVTFIIGDEPLEHKNPSLVKLSSNNGDCAGSSEKHSKIVDSEPNNDKESCKAEVKDRKEKVSICESIGGVGCSIGRNKEALENNDHCDKNLAANAHQNIVNDNEIRIEEISKNFYLDCSLDVAGKTEFKSQDNNEFEYVKEEIKSKSLDSDSVCSEFMPRLVKKVMATQNADARIGIRLEDTSCECQQIETQFCMDDALCDDKANSTMLKKDET